MLTKQKEFSADDCAEQRVPQAKCVPPSENSRQPKLESQESLKAGRL